MRLCAGSAITTCVIAIVVGVGCAPQNDRKRADASQKPWTLEAQAQRTQRLQDSTLDARSPGVIAEARDRRVIIDVAQELSGILEVRTGAGFRRTSERERRDLAVALSHQKNRGMPAMVTFIDSASGNVVAAYNERGERQ